MHKRDFDEQTIPLTVNVRLGSDRDYEVQMEPLGLSLPVAATRYPQSYPVSGSIVTLSSHRETIALIEELRSLPDFAGFSIAPQLITARMKPATAEGIQAAIDMVVAYLKQLYPDKVVTLLLGPYAYMALDRQLPEPSPQANAQAN